MSEKEQQEYINRLRELQKDRDIECAHSAADGILCEILEKLGYNNIVKEYDKINKWYA